MSTRRRNAQPDDETAAAPGAGYIATVKLKSKQGDVLAVSGEACDRVPETSLPWLLEQGLIVPAPPAQE